jgi:hydrogenase maturation protease
MTKVSPVFIGIGNPEKSDDGAGIQLALELKKRGANDVLLESEVCEEENLWKQASDRPLIFLDVVDFREEAGKVVFLPMNFVMNNVSLSHKFLPIVSSMMNYKQLKNAYMLGIQPESVKDGHRLSANVRRAMDDILCELESFFC